jgi:hypothetical protein
MGMKTIGVVIFSIITFVFAGCARQPTLTESTPMATPVPINTDVVQITSTENPTPTETLSPSQTRTRYDLTAVLDYGKRSLSVDEVVTYTNRTSSPLEDILFVIEPNLEDGVFFLESLTWTDGTQVENESLVRNRLTIPLRESLMPGGSVQVNLAYVLYLPGVEGVLCMTDIQANLSGWYPYVAPNIEGYGWMVHDPGKVGESQVYELADFFVNIRIDGAPAEFTLAASARGTYDQGWYRFSQPNARNFTWSGSSSYVMLEAYSGDIRVRAFVFPWDTVGGQASLDATVQALDLYADLYGPYTHDSLTIVESGFTDGMEYDGLYYLGQEYFNTYEGAPNSYLTTISAHETAHDWWYGMVINDQAYEPWLDEALCTYSELLFYEHYYPELVDWWWEQRVNSFQPQGWVDSSIYDFNGFRLYVNAVYLRGAQFLDETRGLVGDEVFMEFLRVLFTKAHERAEVDHLGLLTAEDFWLTLAEMTDVDVSGIKAEYFSHP